MSTAAIPVRRGRRRWLVALGRGALAVAILAYLLHQVSLSGVLHTVSAAAPGALLGAFGCALLAHIVIAERLRRLVFALGMRLSTMALLQINLATVFYGLILPAGNVTGILARFFRISRHTDNRAAIVVALVFERVVTTLTLCLIGIAFWLVDPPHGWPALALISTALAGLLVLQAALFAPAPPGLKRLRSNLDPWWPHKLASLRQAFRQSRTLSRTTLLGLFGLSLLTHAFGIAAFGLVAGALGLDLGLATIAWTRSAAVLIAILPISIAGLGVREGAMVVLLAPYGVGTADALTYSLLGFATTILAVGLIGGLIEACRLARNTDG